MSNLNLAETLPDKVNQLSLLFEISQILNRTGALGLIIQDVMDYTGENLGIKRGTITLLNRQTGNIYIDASYGLSEEEERRGNYKLGEGITGQVIQSGESIIVRKIGHEPRFLNKTHARKSEIELEMSFLCIPIKMGTETFGALAIDKAYSTSESLDLDVQILTVISSLVAQTVRVRQEYQEERERLLLENIRLHQAVEDKFQPQNIIGRSHAMRQVFEMVAQVSSSMATVLIRGESGTGKEMIAQAIHYNSPRRDGPLIRVNCAALPESVIESELFGHEKGAFTGAIAERKGRFELADSGSIFLDEIGELSPSIQVKILRVLQEREFERVGGSKTLNCDVRVITATNRNLEEAMSRGQFREDLFYRLNVFPIHLPPLRERKSDIPQLADFFIEKYNKRNSRNIKRISTSAINLLMSYHWPGNVRELENCIERAVLLASDDVIMGHNLPPTLQSAESSDTMVSPKLQDTLERMEKELILDALKSTKGNYSKAAEILGITERIMGLRVHKFGLEKNRLREAFW